jgi:Arsenate reductase and related proteins, glutaredoxin family
MKLIQQRAGDSTEPPRHTWRKLDAAIQDTVNRDNVAACSPSTRAMIKRPVLDIDGDISIGFKPDLYQSIFNL